MKLLRLNAIFELPDDFEGDWKEAVIKMLDHSETASIKQEPMHLNFNITSWGFTWNHQRGKKLIAEASIWSIKDGGHWRLLNTAPANADSDGSIFVQ